MDIYNEKDKKLFQTFLLNDSNINFDRRRVLCSLPIFTISDKLLDDILKRNKVAEEDIKKIKEYKTKEKMYVENILKKSQITDIIYNYKDEFSKNNDVYLSLENIFFNKKIKYSRDEYIEHLKSTLNYSNKNYKVVLNNHITFKNISITILENNYVIISKNSNPVIHFVIRHPKLIAAIKDFNPLVIEK